MVLHHQCAILFRYKSVVTLNVPIYGQNGHNIYQSQIVEKEETTRTHWLPILLSIMNQIYSAAPPKDMQQNLLKSPILFWHHMLTNT